MRVPFLSPRRRTGPSRGTPSEASGPGAPLADPTTADPLGPVPRAEGSPNRGDPSAMSAHSMSDGDVADKRWWRRIFQR